MDSMVAEALDCLREVVDHLHEDGTCAQALEQHRRLQRLQDVVNGRLKELEGDSSTSIEFAVAFLGGAVPAAAALAAFTPRLPEAGAGAAAEEAQAAILQASAACSAVWVVLWCTKDVVTAAPGALPPDTVFRLAACAGFALGPGLAAAALAHQLAAGRLQGKARREAAFSIGTLCTTALSCLEGLEDMVAALGDATPSAALRTTVARPERLAAACGGCARILAWCTEVLGVEAVLAALQPLMRLAAGHRDQLTHSSGLSSLAATLSTHLELELLQTVSAIDGAEPPLEALEDARQIIETLMCCAVVLPQPALERCVAALAAAVQRLLRQRQPGAAACICHAVGTLALAARRLLESCCPGSAAGSNTRSRQQQSRRQESEQQQQQQQQQAGVPVVALEAVAVCAAGLAAAAELEAAAAQALAASSRGGGGISATAILPAGVAFNQAAKSVIATLLLVARVLVHVAGGGLGVQHMLSALAAAETGVRLAGRLVQLRGQLAALPGAKAAGMNSVLCRAVAAARSASEVLISCCVTVLSHARGDPGTDDKAIAAAVGHLGASAARLGRALAAPGACNGWCDVVLQGIDSLLMVTCHLVVEGCCRWPSGAADDSGDTREGSTVLGNRHLEGVLLPLFASLAAVTAAQGPDSLATRASAHGWKTLEYMCSGGTVGLQVMLMSLMDGLPWLAPLYPELGCARPMVKCLRGVVEVRSEDMPYIMHKMVETLGTSSGPGVLGSWQRSVLSVVSAGILDIVAEWAQLASRQTHGQIGARLVDAWQMVAAVGTAVLLRVGPEVADRATANRLFEALAALPPAALRHRVCSPRFWQQEVRQGLLPALTAAAAAAERAEAEAHGGAAALRRRMAAAFATRACANPTCTNLAGCSEARLRGRRCGGCGVARFCSEACLAAAWPVHAAVCRQPAGQAAVDFSS